MDFSVKEINTVFQAKTPSDLASMVLQKQEEIRESIRWQRLVEDYMGKYAKKLENLESTVNQIELTESPELFYFLHHQDMDLFCGSALSKLYPSWVDKMPLVRVLTYCTRDAVLSAPPLLRQGGLGISAQDAHIIGLDTQGASIRQALPHSCIRTVIKVDNNSENLNNRFAAVLTYIRDNGLHLAGDIWGFLLYINFTGTADEHSLEREIGTIYYEYYIPID